MQLCTRWFGDVWCFCSIKRDLEMFAPNRLYCYAFTYVHKNGKEMCVCVCVFSYRNHILTPVLFCSDTRVRQSTGQERSFKLWEHELSIRQLSLSAQPGVNRHDTSKCLVYGETVLVPLFPLLQSAFFIGMVKTSFQRELVCTHIQQCFLSPSYIGEKSAQIFASRAAILAKLL